MILIHMIILDTIFIIDKVNTRRGKARPPRQLLLIMNTRVFMCRAAIGAGRSSSCHRTLRGYRNRFCIPCIGGAG